MDKENEIEELGGDSMKTLKDFFAKPEPEKLDVTKAKIAASVFSSVVRYKQTQGARDALIWQMATALLTKDQLGLYIRVSQPDSPLVKALPEPKE